MKFKTIIEPFRIKSVEPIHMTSAQARNTCETWLGFLGSIPRSALMGN